MKICEEVEVLLHYSWPKQQMYGELSDSSPGSFGTKQITLSTHWIGGCVGPRAGLDAEEQRKISHPSWDSNPSRPARSPLPYRLTT
jgi:hypothetical protein